MNKYRISKKSIGIMGGICFILLALVTFFSNNTPFAFLSKIITSSFGFVGFYLILPYVIILGISIIAKQKFIKLKVGTSLWGLAIILLCMLILSSHWASIGVEYNGVKIVGFSLTSDDEARYLIFSNARGIFKQINESLESGVGADPKLGGGAVGFVMAGAINSAITPIGLNIVCWAFFIGGLLMIFNSQVKKVALIIKTFFIKKRAKKRTNEYKEISIGSDEEETTNESNQTLLKTSQFQSGINNNSSQKEDNRIYETFHTASNNPNRELQKAHFDLTHEQVIENSLVKKIGEQTIEEPKIKEPIVEEKAPTAPIFEMPSEESIEENIALKQTVLEESIKEENKPEEFEEESNVVIEEEKAPEVDELHRPQPKATIIQNYIYPGLDLLEFKESNEDKEANENASLSRTEQITNKLNELKIGASVVGHTIGPAVTRFDIQMNSGVSVNTMAKYVNDLSAALNGVFVRYQPIVAGKSTSGLEVPNEKRTTVGLKESIAGLPCGEKNSLVIPFGRSISNDLVYANLGDFPHLLVAGTTGSGKTIFMHSVILTLIMRNRPDELKLVLIDPKKVEMNFYKGIPHLLCPNISDPKQAYVAFTKLVDEMERRFNIFADNGVRDIKGFNVFAKEHGIQPLPKILVIIDEFADLMDTCKEIHDPVVRIAQKARAAGIHMIIATQRPSVNVIDGVIKGNVATRVALMCASYTDSQTIIGEGGAEKLLGNGDMLVDCALLSRSEKPRIQGCFVTEPEITRVCQFLCEHYPAQYDPNFLNLVPKQPEKVQDNTPSRADLKEEDDEKLLEIVKEDIVSKEFVSISYLVRAYSIGFSRAGKIIKRLQDDGYVDTVTVSAKGNKVLKYNPGGGVDTLEQSTFIPDEN